MSMFSWASNLLDSVDSTAQETIQQQLSKSKANRTPLRDTRTDTPLSTATAISNASIPPRADSPTSSSSSSSTLAPPVAAAIAPPKIDKSPRRQKRLVQPLPSTPPTKPVPAAAIAVLSDDSISTHNSHAEGAHGLNSADPSTPTPASPVPTPLESTADSSDTLTNSASAELDAHSNSGDEGEASTPEAPATPDANATDAADAAPAPTTTEPPAIAAQPAEPNTAEVAPTATAQSEPQPPPTAAPVVPLLGKGKKTSSASSLLPTASAFFSSALASASSSPVIASTPSTSSSSVPAAASSASSASSEAAAEIASLRAVWNESREQVAKAKKLLALKEESHSKALQKLSNDWQTAMDAQQTEYEEKARRLQEVMDRQTADFQQAMTTRKEHAMELTAKEAEHEGTIEQLQQRLQAMEEKQQQLMDEREQMMNMHSAALSQHQTLLARLRAEESERMASLEAEVKAKTSSYALRQDRDMSQEEEQIQYTHIAAQVQRELEDKTRQLDRVMAEKRWIEADQQSLNDQLSTMKTRVDEQQKQLQTQQASSRERATAHTAELTSLKQQLASQQQQLQQFEQTNTTLQQQLQDATATNSHSASSRPDSEWEERIRAMTEHLMSKSTQIDRLSAERTALSVQLDDARARLTAFEKQAKKERERTLEDMEAGGSNGLKGMGSNGELMAGKGKVTSLDHSRHTSVAGRGVVQAVSALDWLGAMTGQMLRRYAWVRVAFAAYVFVIHVWVLFILFHLIGEMEGPEQSTAAAVDGVPNVAAAASAFVRSRSHQLGNG